jgi:hypothetical protein
MRKFPRSWMPHELLPPIRQNGSRMHKHCCRR